MSVRSLRNGLPDGPEPSVGKPVKKRVCLFLNGTSIRVVSWGNLPMGSFEWIRSLFAAHGYASGTEMLFCLAFVVAIIIIAAIIGAGTRCEVIVRNGLPYCPNCNRQVTYRRDHCRACGHVYKYYGKSPSEKAAEEEQAREERARQYAQETRRREIVWQEMQRAVTKEETDCPDELTPTAKDRPETRFSSGRLILYGMALLAVLSATMAISYYSASVPLTQPNKGDTAVFSLDDHPNPKDKPIEQPDREGNTVVYVTRDGVRYHKDGCIQLVDERIPMRLDDAVSRFAPCRECCLWNDPPKAVPPEKANRATALIHLARNLERAKKPEGAARFYRLVIVDFPGSLEAKVAAERLKTLPPGTDLP